MRLRILLIFSLLTSVFFCYAQQDIEQIKREINKVKKSNSYLYGEANAETEEEAHNIAEEILYKEINDWASKKKKLQGGELIINNKKEFQSYLSLPRGNMVRAFVYVKKSDIAISRHAEVIKTKPSSLDASVSQSSITPIFSPTVEEMASCTEYNQLETKLEAEKQAGHIRHYALYGKLSNPQPYYLIIFNKAGKVVAVLSKGANRVNVKTGKPDSVDNYSGCGAIGFSVNE